MILKPIRTDEYERLAFKVPVTFIRLVGPRSASDVDTEGDQHTCPALPYPALPFVLMTIRNDLLFLDHPVRPPPPPAAPPLVLPAPHCRYNERGVSGDKKHYKGVGEVGCYRVAIEWEPSVRPSCI